MFYLLEFWKFVEITKFILRMIDILSTECQVHKYRVIFG